MAEREKLIEILGGMSGIAWSPSVRGIIADYLLANGVTVQKWVPVSERLPEPGDGEGGGIVLVSIVWRNGERDIVQAYHDGENWHWWAVDYGTYYCRDVAATTEVTITHWMPLPEPPKEET